MNDKPTISLDDVCRAYQPMMNLADKIGVSFIVFGASLAILGIVASLQGYDYENDGTKCWIMGIGGGVLTIIGALILVWGG